MRFYLRAVLCLVLVACSRFQDDIASVYYMSKARHGFGGEKWSSENFVDFLGEVYDTVCGGPQQCSAGGLALSFSAETRRQMRTQGWDFSRLMHKNPADLRLGSHIIPSSGVGVTGDGEFLGMVSEALHAFIPLSPEQHSIWLNLDLRSVRMWGVLTAFSPTVTLVFLKGFGFRASLYVQHYSLLAHAFVPYWPFSKSALDLYYDDNPLCCILFFVACTLGNVINLVFLAVAARDKWPRIPFLFAVELFLLACAWVVWGTLEWLVNSAILKYLCALIMLSIPVIRYTVVIQFQDGEFEWECKDFCPCLLVARTTKHKSR